MGKVRLPPIGFWSYVRRDDERNRGRISQLRELILAELGTQIGGDVPVFKDTISIPHGARWEELTRAALSNATFFIPVLTPDFLQSHWCCREVRLFLDRERELLDRHPDLPRRSRVFPIHYVQVEEDADTVDEFVRDTLMGLQHLVFHPRRNADYAAPEICDLVAAYVGDIRQLLLAKVEGPVAPPPPPPPPAPPPPAPPDPPPTPPPQPGADETTASKLDRSTMLVGGGLLLLMLSIIVFAVLGQQERARNHSIEPYYAMNEAEDANMAVEGMTDGMDANDAIYPSEMNGQIQDKSGWDCPPDSNCAP